MNEQQWQAWWTHFLSGVLWLGGSLSMGLILGENYSASQEATVWRWLQHMDTTVPWPTCLAFLAGPAFATIALLEFLRLRDI